MTADSSREEDRVQVWQQRLLAEEDRGLIWLVIMEKQKSIVSRRL